MAIDPDNPLALLGGLCPREFLRDYWQRKPLLVRQAVPGFESPLSPEELAGLACEEAVISRLVQEQAAERAWAVRQGPFEEDDFLTLPETRWTLLVSDVEKHLPDLRAWLEPFRFVPDWRLDDLMISYAAPGGSVGPHVDQYDVFLLQAHGRRRWQVSTAPMGHDNFLPDLDLRIIRDFAPEQEWVLEPGDMLYLPPRVAHHGVAEGPCMTWSVGFRAPAWRDLLAAWMDARYEALPADARYCDAGMAPQAHPAEITPDALARMVRGLRENLAADDAALGRWLARHLTEPKAELVEHLPLPEALPEDRARALLEGEDTLERHGAARLAFIREGDGMRLFINGREHEVPPGGRALTEFLCAETCYRAADLRRLAGDIPEARTLLLNLCMAGVLLPIPDGSTRGRGD